MMKAIISLIRPQQWAKNGFVLLPLFFGGQLLSLWCWIEALWTFLAFSFMASSVYCLNDIRDIEADRLHPKKCKRPLAAGLIKPGHAVALMVSLAAASLAISLLALDYANLKVCLILCAYLMLNIAYCLKLKRFAIVDVMIVSFGFVLRLVSGGMACRIWLSPWIVLMTFLLALFLAFAKRRDDVVLYEEKKVVVRRNVVRYNLPFMNQTLGIIGAVTIVCYIMYTLSPDVIARFDNGYLYVTSLFVIAAVLRYLQLSLVDCTTGSPTRILMRDRFIQVCLVLWVISFALMIYI